MQSANHDLIVNRYDAIPYFAQVIYTQQYFAYNYNSLRKQGFYTSVSI
jgi:hypothetical protein